jgi:hypothetical protein
MNKIILPYATVEYIEPVIYFRITRDVVMDVKEVIEVMEAGNKVANYQPHVLLTDARISVDVTAEGRKAGESRDNTQYLVAQAVVVKYLAQRLIANVFMTINKPKFPMQVFNDEQKALDWLMKKWNASKDKNRLSNAQNFK